MINTFILLASVIVLHFCACVSGSAGELLICGHSKYGFGEKLTTVASYMGYRVTILTGAECDFNTTLENISSMTDSKVVVNFNVVNPESKRQDILFDIDMVEEYYGTLDESLPSCTDNPIQIDRYKRNCMDPDFNKLTKLFIGSFDKHQALYNAYKTITNNLIEEWDINYFQKEIVVCSDAKHPCKIINNKPGFLIYCKSCHEEFECSDNTIAIIAPSPKKLKTCDERIPVIFYDTIYVESNNIRTVYEEHDTSNFITSTTMVHWKELASSLRIYLSFYSWPRVAIVSDDSLLSYHMTNDQMKYLEDGKALFTVIRDCTEESDFKEALTFLNKFESRVIIVNVVKQNLRKFMEAAKAAYLTDANIIWVFPGHRDSDIKGFKYKAFVYFTCDVKKVVQFVINKYKESLGTNFKEKIIDNQPTRSCPGICSNITRSIPSTMDSSLAGINCALKTSNYFHQCADWYVLYLILAIIVFLLLVFAVLLLFNHIQMNTLEYKPLNRPPALWRQLLWRERPVLRQSFPMRRRY